MATFVSLGAVLLALVGLVYLGAQPKAVPHIIEIDHLGAPTYRGPVAQGDYVPPDAAIKYHLHRFLEDTRTISSDIAVVKRNWLDAYTLCSQRGGNMLTSYVQAPGNDPFRRALEERVTIEIVSTVRACRRTPGSLIGARRSGTRPASRKPRPSSGGPCSAPSLESPRPRRP